MHAVTAPDVIYHVDGTRVVYGELGEWMGGRLGANVHRISKLTLLPRSTTIL